MQTRDVLNAAAEELGVLAAGESLSAEDADALLRRLNRILDSWNAKRAAVYRTVFTTYTLTPSLSPHTIGATGATFTASQRPVAIDSATLIYSDDARTPVLVRDASWWRLVRDKTITSDVPTDLYYDPAWPNGAIYLWPIPSAANELEIEARIVLADLALDDTFTLPPGYLEALTLTLAEKSAGLFGRPLPEALPKDAAMARATVFDNNDETPHLQTADAGLGGGGRVYDWRVGPLG